MYLMYQRFNLWTSLFLVLVYVSVRQKIARGHPILPYRTPSIFEIAFVGPIVLSDQMIEVAYQD